MIGLDEFRKNISDGYMVICRSQEETYNTLCLIEDLGFLISAETKRNAMAYENNASNNFVTYPHPGMSKLTPGTIVRYSGDGGKCIDYSEIKHLIQTPTFDVCNDDEFECFLQSLFE